MEFIFSPRFSLNYPSGILHRAELFRVRNKYFNMASKALKKPFLRVTRSYSTQTAARPRPVSAQSADITSTVLPNKLIVASLENYSPISRVSILFRAGSRYEKWESLGSTHALRIAAGLGTKKSTQFGITRNIQQVGGSLSITADRESVAYTLETKRDALESSLKYLNDVATQQIFKPWELSDNIPRLQFELAALSPQVRVLDLLHKAAYRSGLGNSLFCPDHLVGKLNSETLQHYVQCLFTTNRAAVVGVGVDHDSLLAYAQNLTLESGDGPQSDAKYWAGELRVDTASQLAHVAVAVEGASLKNLNEMLAYAVLQYALGVGPSVKWGSSSASPLAKAVAANNLECNPFAVSALNVNYSDSGLFGFVASSPANVAGLVVEAAVKQLRSTSVTDADVTRAKAQLKTAILLGLESGSDVIQEVGSQALILGSVMSGAKLVAAVDNVQKSDVNAAAKKVASGKLSLAAIGKLPCVPYLDELK